MKNQDYLYLDHAASTPMRKSALDKYIEAESFGFANSSGGHKLSRNSKNLLEDSREIIAELLDSAPSEIVFTSGGTEADNWTIKSLFDSKQPNNNLVTSNIEHEAVLASAEWISSNGFQTKYAKSDENGFVTKDEFIKQIDDEVRSIIQTCYEKAGSILAANLDKLHNMADALLKYETIDQDQISDIMAGALPRDKSDDNDQDKTKKTKVSSSSKPIQGT